MHSFIKSPGDEKIAFDAVQLTTILQDSLPGAVVEQLRYTRIGEDFGFASRVYRCYLTGHGVPASIVLKLWNEADAGSLREVEFFRFIAPDCRIRMPGCYYAASSPQDGKGVLILEDFPDAIQGDCLTQMEAAGARSIAHIVGKLQAGWWESPALCADWLPSFSSVTKDSDWHTSRREEFLSRFSGQLAPELLPFALHSEEFIARSNRLLEGAPQTLLHADLHLDNILFVGPTAQPVILDWARCASGPAALDLAEVMFGIGRADDCESTLSAFIDGLESEDVKAPERGDLRRQLCGAVLRHGVWITLGTAMWTPQSPRQASILHANFARQIEAMRWVEREMPGSFRI